MAALNLLPSYVASVWNATLASLSYVEAQLPSFSGNAGLSLVLTLASTLRNARDAIDAFVLSYYASRAYGIVAPVLAQPLGIDPDTLLYVQARLSALQSFAISTSAIRPAPASLASTALAAGRPAVPDPLLLEYLVGFSAEQYLGVKHGRASTSGFAAVAQSMATAWDMFSSAAVAGRVSGTVVDEIDYMASASQALADIVALAPPSAAIAGVQPVTAAWNGMVALPSIVRMVCGDSSDPTNAAAQQTFVARTVLAQLLEQAYILALTLSRSAPVYVKLATVRVGDSLMSIAARELGDYTQWQVIASLNGLVPPYVAAAPAPNVAAPGQQLYMPGGAAPTQPPSAEGASQYEASFLGTDLYYGPTGQDMLPWTGDLQTIVGYQNLAFSLGRRLQTPLSTLTYHLEFGSRVPGEIGSVQTQSTVGNIEAYGTSSILGDPRVSRVLSVKATVAGGNAINVRFLALPSGAQVSSAPVSNGPAGTTIGGIQGSMP